jgi:hypothetical protein
VEEEKQDLDETFYDNKHGEPDQLESAMVPGYYMSKRGVSLPKLEDRNLSLDVTHENSISMTV